jgi:hypothetical protein
VPFWPTLLLEPTAGAFPASGLVPILSYLDPGMGSYALQILLA